MEPQDLEFLDLSNISEREAKEIYTLLNPPGGIQYVELPWMPNTTYANLREPQTTEQPENIRKDSNIVDARISSMTPALRPPSGSLANPSVVPPPFISPSVASAVPHLAGSQAFPFIPRSYPLLHPHFPQHMNSIFTRSVPQQELTAVQQSSLPPAFPIHTSHREYIPVMHVSSDKTLITQKKGLVSANKQMSQSDKNSGSSDNSVNDSDAQQADQHRTVVEEPMPTGMPSVVPVPFTMPPNSFPVTTGTIPVAAAATGYPPGIAPVHYQPQGPSAPLLYAVPFITSAYPGFIHPQAPLAVRSEHLEKEKEHSSENDGGVIITNSAVTSVVAEIPSVTLTCSESTPIETCATHGQHSQTCDDCNLQKPQVDIYQIIQHGNLQNNHIVQTSKSFIKNEDSFKNDGKNKLDVSSDNENESHGGISASRIIVNSSTINMTDTQPALSQQMSANEPLSSFHTEDTFSCDTKSLVRSNKFSDVYSDCTITESQSKIPIVKEDCSNVDVSTSVTSVMINNDAENTRNTNVWHRRSGADLFKDQRAGQITSQECQSLSLPPVSTAEFKESEENGRLEDTEEYQIIKAEEDVLAIKLANIFENTRLNHIAPFLQPRGLINRSNWCYINATLQALLVCPPLYNLLKQFTSLLGQNRNKSSTPILDSLVEFIQEFPTLPQASKNKRKEDLAIGASFEPGNIYKMLSVIKSECVKGRQEDAEEFLSCILNGLHEEMLAVMKSIRKDVGKEAGNGEAAANGHLDDSGDEGWQVMGPKNKSIVTRTASFSRSPISDIFGGQMRSVLMAGNETSAFLQPFFTLQLDIQSEQVESVLAALEHLTSKESIQGYTCTKTKQEVEASRRITLEELPLVLVLHFKRFVYDKDGGSKKVDKCAEYAVTLDLTGDILSQEVRSKYSHKSLRTYKLFAVVYHEGKEAVKGHYITDVYHAGSGGWLRCDDRTITPITETQLLRYSPPRVPYLLFYRRLDTIQPGSGFLLK
ncbi:ubiquitin carboxyl-terminal hydrolase 10-like [Limulus polyphemus]|uniref:ubiquitinyl hydrolase 1 n=1 Tax=Limulus polyphemus TaxID=6850 RepID=A0ABM1AZU3_LIMPO|nr:ubiquitin carboxyl-terminal hydrolase 10-like [Limulus polyphemus]